MLWPKSDLPGLWKSSGKWVWSCCSLGWVFESVARCCHWVCEHRSRLILDAHLKTFPMWLLCCSVLWLQWPSGWASIKQISGWCFITVPRRKWNPIIKKLGELVVTGFLLLVTSCGQLQTCLLTGNRLKTAALTQPKQTRSERSRVGLRIGFTQNSSKPFPTRGWCQVCCTSRTDSRRIRERTSITAVILVQVLLSEDALQGSQWENPVASPVNHLAWS